MLARGLSSVFSSQYLETFGRRVAEEITLAVVKDVSKASGKARGNLETPVALERAGQGLGSLLVVARGVGSALRQPLPVTPHVQAPVWSVAHFGHPACMSGIVSSVADNVNAMNTEYASGSELRPLVASQATAKTAPLSTEKGRPGKRLLVGVSDTAGRHVPSTRRVTIAVR